MGAYSSRVPNGREARSGSTQAPGAGEVVVKRAIPTEASIRASHSLFLVETEAQGIVPTRKLLEVGPVPAPPHVATRLGINAEEQAIVRRRLMLANDVPVRISNSWFSVNIAHQTGLETPDFIPLGLQDLFETFNYEFGFALETLTARLPTAEEMALLAIAHDSPVVHILRSSYDTHKLHVHTLESICAAERHIFEVRQVEADRVF
jgi:GntR family transcriptional regulator